jgi:uncharacterized protein (TIGR02246 family)
MRRLVLATLAPLVFLSCTQTDDQQAATTTAAEIEAVTTMFDEFVAAFVAEDLAGSIANWAENGVSMPPDGPPLIGKEAIRSDYQAAIEGWDIQISHRIEDVTVSGEMALVVATFDETLTPRAGGDPTELHGRWLLVLKKQPDGSWKVWRDMWSYFPPPETT